MPANAVKPGQEAAWEKAKEQAKKQGQDGNWAYVMAIFKNMVGKEASMEPSASYPSFGAASILQGARDALKNGELRVALEMVEEWVPKRVLSAARRLVNRESDEGKHSQATRIAVSQAIESARAALSSKVAYDEKGRDPDPNVGWQDGVVEPFVQNVGEGSQVPPARDHGGNILEKPVEPHARQATELFAAWGMPVSGSGFTTIDPVVHQRIDRVVTRGSHLCGEAQRLMHDMTSSMYPPEFDELENVRGLLQDVLTSIDEIERLLPK